MLSLADSTKVLEGTKRALYTESDSNESATKAMYISQPITISRVPCLSPYKTMPLPPQSSILKKNKVFNLCTAVR
jgi:hypothetical protein